MGSRRVFPIVSVALVATLSGCSPPPPAGDAPTAAKPAMEELAPPRTVLADGTVITLELAVTNEELATGLMYRPSLAPDRGMLLLFAAERRPSIWMKNTLLGLDLLFLDDVGIVVDTILGVPPCAADPCPTYSSDKPTRAVLEIAAGGVERYGIEVGDRLVFERVPGYPAANSEIGIRNSELPANSPP